VINSKNNDENNDVTIAGTDFFTDTESFLNELTDDELQQVREVEMSPPLSELVAGASFYAIMAD
jgi:hypothetical protein